MILHFFVNQICKHIVAWSPSNESLSAQWAVLLICFVSFLSGCATSMILPERFATAEEAYPTTGSYTLSSDVPKDSYKTAMFNASYDAVFRAVTVAASNKGMNIESSDKGSGIVLGVSGGNVGTRKAQFYYAIKISKIKLTATEVQILSKAQVQCTKDTATGIGVFSVLTLGLGTPALPMIMQANKQCEEVSKTHWIGQDESQQALLVAILAETRTRLYAGGEM